MLRQVVDYGDSATPNVKEKLGDTRRKRVYDHAGW
jgi:hypothetical protein